MSSVIARETYLLLRLHPDDSRVGRWIARLSLWLALGAAAVLALMMCLIVVDVVGRYFLNRPITGSVEIIYCMMGLVVFMGIGLCTYEEGHVRVDIVTSMMPEMGRAVCNVLAHLVSTGTAGLVVWRLYAEAIAKTREDDLTQVLALPVWLVACVMALCSTLLVLTLTLHLVRAVEDLLSLRRRKRAG